MGGLLNYSDCTACALGSINIKPTADAYFFCVDECPSGYDNSTQCDVQSGAILDFEFDIPYTAFTNNAALTTGSFDVIVTTDVPSGQPAKYRGLYFTSSKSAYIEIENIILAHTFSVHSWVLQ
jgi:hypothetical protein